MMIFAAEYIVAVVHAVTFMRPEQAGILHLFSCCAHAAAQFCA